MPASDYVQPGASVGIIAFAAYLVRKLGKFDNTSIRIVDEECQRNLAAARIEIAEVKAKAAQDLAAVKDKAAQDVADLRVRVAQLEGEINQLKGMRT